MSVRCHNVLKLCLLHVIQRNEQFIVTAKKEKCDCDDIKCIKKYVLNFFNIKQCQYLSNVLIVKTMCTKPAPLKTCCTCFDDVNKILCVKGKSGLEI